MPLPNCSRGIVDCVFMPDPPSRILGVGFDALAARLQRRHLHAASLRDRSRTVLVRERVESGADHIVRVGRALALGDDVVHAQRFEHGAHRTTRDDAGAGGRRAQNDAPCAMTAVDVVMQRAALAQRHADDAAFGRFGRLANRLRHLARLAVAVPDPTLLIAHHDERSEAEAASALHDLRNPVDVHQAIDELAVAILPAMIATAAAFSFTRHFFVPSLARRAWRRSLGVCRIQKSRPPSRAPSASALTRPWDMYAARAHTTFSTPAFFARSAISLPTRRAASTFAPDFSASRIAFSSDDAAARVTPFESSMTCA